MHDALTAPSPYSFTFEPLFAFLALLAAIIYARAARRESVPVWKLAAFGLGLALVVAALNSPLETLAIHYLLVVHLLQNVILADWAPPLLLIGLTPMMRAAIARRGGRPLAWLTRPQIVLPLWLVGWYGIHLPVFYEYALRNHWALYIEHALLIAIGVLYWWPVISDSPHYVSTGLKLGYLGAGFVGASFLGLVFTFSTSEPLYEYYAGVRRLWGLSAIEDQNFGGILMNSEQAIVFFAAIAYFLVRLLREEDGRERALRASQSRVHEDAAESPKGRG